MQILIAEDGESVARFLKQAVMKALRLIVTGAFDPTVLDVMAPRMDGFETCRRMRALLRRVSPVVRAVADLTLRPE